MRRIPAAEEAATFLVGVPVALLLAGTGTIVAQGLERCVVPAGEVGFHARPPR